MSATRKIAVLTSGGLDSAILLHELGKKYHFVRPIYVRSGHIWEKAELVWLKRFLRLVRTPSVKPLALLSLPTEDLYRRHWSQTGKAVPGPRSSDRTVYLPGKNILLIAKASVYCALRKIPCLAIGSLKTNPFPDASPSFLRRMTEACSRGLNFKLRIVAPFLNRPKQEVMMQGRNLPLQLTFSCLSPRGFSHCGCCNKCAERKKAFRQARMIDSTCYAH